MKAPVAVPVRVDGFVTMTFCAPADFAGVVHVSDVADAKTTDVHEVPPIVTVAPDTPLTEIAAMLEKYHIKRVPVMEGGKLVGIVSRANLLRGVATWQKPTGVRVEDSALRELLLKALNEAELPMHLVNVTVTDGAVELWGVVDSELQVEAARAAAEATVGVVRFESHLIRRA